MSNFKIRRLRNTTYAIYTHGGKILKISTGVQVVDKNWENDHVSRSDPHHKAKNEIIGNKLQLLRQAYLQVTVDNLEPTVHRIKTKLNQITKAGIDPEKEVDSFIYLFENYHASKKGTRALTTLSNINQTILGLRAFESSRSLKITLQTFTREMFTELIQFYLDICGYNDRTIDKHLKVIRGFLKWAYPDFNRTVITYKMKKDETVIHLTEDELTILINAELEGSLIKVRDLFLFACLTGMRYSDLAKFNRSWLQDGVIIYNQAKTTGIAISPVFVNAEKILKKYNYTLPLISNPKFNLYLKNLFRYLELNREITVVKYHGNQRTEIREPLHKLVTTHVARKTFISLALANGIPIQDVMRMSGHSDYRGIRPYISVTKEHIIKISKKWKI